LFPAVDVAADASQSCRDLLKKLLEAGWEAEAFDSLATLLKPHNAAVAAAAGNAGSGAAGALVVAQQAAAEMCHVVSR
jgi:hypothetical protein